jgi:hypothetical protein
LTASPQACAPYGTGWISSRESSGGYGRICGHYKKNSYVVSAEEEGGLAMAVVTADLRVQIGIPITAKEEVAPIEILTKSGNQVKILPPTRHPDIPAELEGKPITLPPQVDTIRLEVRTEGELPEKPEAIGSALAPEVPFMRAALIEGVRIFCDFLKLYRAIFKTRGYVAYEVSNLAMHPLVESYSVHWYTERKLLTGGGTTLTGSSRPLNSEQWAGLGKKLQSGMTPPIHLDLLLDSEFFLSIQDIKRSILFGAIATEVCVKRFLLTVGAGGNQIYAQVVEKRWDISVLELIEDVLPTVTGGHISGLGDELRLWLKRLFETRNKIAHEGRPYYRTGSGKEAAVDQTAALQMIVAARETIRWIESFDTKRLMH